MYIPKRKATDFKVGGKVRLANDVKCTHGTFTAFHEFIITGIGYRGPILMDSEGVFLHDMDWLHLTLEDLIEI